MDSFLQPAQTTIIGTRRLWVCMYGAFFLTGIAVLMLGPLLPLFSRQWGLPDSQLGMLLTAQFAGSFSGAVLLRHDLRKSFMNGSVCFAAGYLALAFASDYATGFRVGCVALLVGGFGIGQLINTVSLIAARLHKGRHGAALMSLNLTWSAGALLAPLLIGIAKGHLSLHAMLMAVALVAGLMLFFQLLMVPDIFRKGQLGEMLLDAPIGKYTWSLRGPLLYFAALFFLYGALENSVTGWIAIFTVRYTHSDVAVGAYSTTMLWVGITAGRGMSLLLLRRFSERAIQVAGIIATIVAVALLHTIDKTGRLFVLAAILGVCLAPFIPVTSSIFLAEAPSTPRQAGIVMAAAALGGAVLPLLVGIVSQHYASLRSALELPLVVGLILLGCCLLPQPGEKSVKFP